MTSEQYPWLVWPSSSGIAFSPLSSLKLAAVTACVRLLAESASTLPLKVYRGEGPDRVPSDSPLAGLLRSPSPGTTLPSLIGMTVAWMALAGNCYWAKLRSPDGIVQLAAIPADRVAVELVGGEPFYTLHLDTGPSIHGTFDIVHMRMPVSLDGILGVSPIGHAREQLGLAATVEQTAVSLFSNQAIPRGVLAVNSGGADNDDLIDNLSVGFRERHGGSGNAGRVAVIDAAAVTYSAVGLSPADAELLATMRASDTQIARIFRVPPSLIAAESGTSMTYTTVAMEAENFARFTLASYLVAIEQAISNDPDLCLPDEHVEFDLSRFERPDALTRAQTYALGRQWGWLSEDDVRAAEGLPPLTEPLPIFAAPTPIGEPHEPAAA